MARRSLSTTTVYAADVDVPSHGEGPPAHLRERARGAVRLAWEPAGALSDRGVSVERRHRRSAAGTAGSGVAPSSSTWTTNDSRGHGSTVTILSQVARSGNLDRRL